MNDTPTNSGEPLLRWFETGHLRVDLHPLVDSYKGLAYLVVATNSPSTERTVALRKLIESKDAAVRAAILTKGGA